MNGFQVLRIFEWIIKFAYIQLLWVCFSVLGVVIFGIFPATAAMFAVMRKWLMGETDIPVLKSFFEFYKENFIKGNVLGFILSIIAFTLFIDFQLLNQASGIVIRLLFYLLLAITFMFIITSLYTFPMLVRSNFSVLQVLKNSFFIMIVSPLSTIMIIAASIIHLFTILQFPGLIFVFGISPIIFIIMWSTNLSYLNIERKKEIMN